MANFQIEQLKEAVAANRHVPKYLLGDAEIDRDPDQYAIGSNEKTARLCGVAVERVKLWAYGLSGLCAGLSGVMLLSRQRQGDPTGAMGSELDVIAAVVIGGGSLSGGEGSIFGSIVGALIMTVIRAGCNQWGLDVWVTQVVTGAIIVIAVALDRLRHRRSV